MDILNLVFIFFSLIAISILVFYFYKLAQHDKEEWLKKGVEHAVEEKTAEEWLHSLFVPQVLNLIQKNPKIVIKYTFIVLMVSVFLWTLATEGLYIAARNTFFASISYVFAILYIYTEPRLFSYVKNHLPRKIRHSFDNDWIRAYAFFFLPACLLYFFIPKPFSFLSFLFLYSALFLCLVAATRISIDFDKEEEKERKHLIKKTLDENN